MEMTLKPYSEYKGTGLPWLRAVPAHWDLVRTKHLFSERVQKGYPDEPLLAATQTKGVVRKEKYGSRTVTAMKDLHLLKLVEPGDYVISLRSFEGGIELAHDRGIISPAYTVLNPGPRALEGYFAHFFKSKIFIDSLSLYVTGIREGQNIDYKRLSRNELPVPPPEEQEAIGRFLKAKVGQANRLIRAKQRLIALLNEQKQAIIQRAVTRGLDPDVPLKPSGVDWLGEVPAHWEVMRLKHTLLGRLEYGANESAKEATRDHPRYIRITDFGSDGTLREETFRSLPPHIAQNYLLSEGDILFARSGATVGKTFQFKGYQTAACYAGYLIKASLSPEFLRSDFIYIYTKSKSYSDWKMGIFIQATIQNIGADKYKELSVPVPPVGEQDVIVDFLLSELSQINAVLSTAHEEIALIREYRTRLIADVVTGKLDVRGVAVPKVENDADADLDVGESDEPILDEEALPLEEDV